MALIFF